MKKNTTILAIIIIIVLVTGMVFYLLNIKKQEPMVETENQSIKVTAKGIKYIVDPDKIVSGGPPRDGIPSIDHPKFVSVEEADNWIQDNELVLGIIYKGVKRVYPLQIMVWHEIVNDNIAGDPILITYCPLCGSGIAYNRTINGEEVEFGTSGKLYNSTWSCMTGKQSLIGRKSRG